MKQRDNMEIIWEYIVRPEYLDQFVEIYSPAGAWAELFKKHPGYGGTTLIQDTSNKNRFITIDHWGSAAAYADMKHASRKEYKALDEQCEIFTVDENYIGVFDIVS